MYYNYIGSFFVFFIMGLFLGLKNLFQIFIWEDKEIIHYIQTVTFFLVITLYSFLKGLPEVDQSNVQSVFTIIFGVMLFFEAISFGENRNKYKGVRPYPKEYKLSIITLICNMILVIFAGLQISGVLPDLLMLIF